MDAVIMAWKLTYMPVLSAVAVATKNALVLAAVQLLTGVMAIVTTIVAPNTLSVVDVSDFVGPRVVASTFAVIGAFWRWHRYRLNIHSGISGCAFSVVLAFIVGDGQVPYIDALTKNIARESIPMMNGFIMGLFGLLLVTGVQDFIAVYRGSRKAGDA